MRFLATLATLTGLLSSGLAIPFTSTSDACCCCDISQNAISCTTAVPADQCVCAAVVCPVDASTVWPDATPTPTPVSPLDRTPVGREPVEEPCCCCNIGKGEVTCEMREAGDCFCAAVVCPPAAPTVWPQSTSPGPPEYTSY